MLELAETVKEVSKFLASSLYDLFNWRHFDPLIQSVHTKNTLILFPTQLINPNVEIKMVENTPDDPRQRKPDITKAKELLGWEPKIKLRDGLPLMEDDFRTRLGVPRKN